MPDMPPAKLSFLEGLGISKLIDLYQRREHAVNTAIEVLQGQPVSRGVKRGFKVRAKAVQDSVKRAPKGTGFSAIGAACEALQSLFVQILAVLSPLARNYLIRLAAVELLQAKLKAAAVGREANKVAALVANAKKEAADGNLEKSIALLDTAAHACKEAERLLLDYLKAVGSAMVVFAAARPHMSELDVRTATAALDAAAAQASQGNRDVAATLIAEVEPLCRIAVKAAKDTDYLAVAALARGLTQHPAHAAFEKQIWQLMQRLGIIRQKVADRQSSKEEDDDEDEDEDEDGSPLSIEIAMFLRDARHLGALMERHIAFARLAKTAGDAMATLSRFDPRGCNAAIQHLLAGPAQTLELARQQAAGHDYDRAQSTLKQVIQECAAKEQAACGEGLRAVEHGIMQIPKTELFSHDAGVLNQLLGMAKAAATAGRFDSASRLLAWTQRKLLALRALSDKVGPINDAMQEVTRLMHTAPQEALAKARTFFNALKARARRAGFEQPLHMIAELFARADRQFLPTLSKPWICFVN